MAYGKKSGGCTPITAKIQKTTKGGIVQPILNVGKVSPAKMKGDLNKDGKMSGYEQTRQDAIDKAMSSPAKLTPASMVTRLASGITQAAKHRKNAQEAGHGGNLATGYGFIKGFLSGKSNKAETPKYQAPSVQPVSDKKSSNTSGKSMTPYSVKDGKGIIHGPKVSYDMAYKNRDMKTYGGMSKAEYIAESKRQTKSFESTGKWDAPKPRKKQTSIVAPKAKTVSIETKKPTASVEVKVTKAIEPTKTQVRKAKSIDKKLAKAKKARAEGNIKKAERKEKRAAKKAQRIVQRSRK